MDAKKPWQSKTLWVNLLLAGAAFVPAISSIVGKNPEYAGMVVGLINMVLRFITKDAIQLVDDTKNDQAQK